MILTMKRDDQNGDVCLSYKRGGLVETFILDETDRDLLESHLKWLRWDEKQQVRTRNEIYKGIGNAFISRP